MGKRKSLRSVLTDDLEHCIVTGLSPVQIHHIFGGRGRRSFSDEDGFVIPLTADKHTGKDGIHNNRIMDLYWKGVAQTYFEKNMGTRKEFIARYGKSWL